MLKTGQATARSSLALRLVVAFAAAVIVTALATAALLDVRNADQSAVDGQSRFEAAVAAGRYWELQRHQQSVVDVARDAAVLDSAREWERQRRLQTADPLREVTESAQEWEQQRRVQSPDS
jgi:hypothetical protein